MSDVTEGRLYKWEIEPHPYNSDYDVMVTDDDEQALQAVQDAAEKAWDSVEPGERRTIEIRLNKVTP